MQHCGILCERLEACSTSNNRPTIVASFIWSTSNGSRIWQTRGRGRSLNQHLLCSGGVRGHAPAANVEKWRFKSCILEHILGKIWSSPPLSSFRRITPTTTCLFYVKARYDRQYLTFFFNLRVYTAIIKRSNSKMRAVPLKVYKGWRGF